MKEQYHCSIVCQYCQYETMLVTSHMTKMQFCNIKISKGRENAHRTHDLLMVFKENGDGRKVWAQGRKLSSLARVI